jgi:streptogramin lyase
MRIDDRLRHAMVREVSGFEASEAAWARIERGISRRRARIRVVRVLTAVVTLALFAGLLGGLWLALQPSSKVHRVGQAPTSPQPDPRLTATIDLSGEGHVPSLLVAEGSLWVAASGESAGTPELLRIDPGTNAIVARIPVATVPGWEVSGDGIAAGAGSIWLTGRSHAEDGAVLVRVDPDSNRATATIPLSGTEGGDVVVAPSGVWVTVFGRASTVEVLRIDPVTNQVVATIPMEGEWVRAIMAIDGHVIVHHREGDVWLLTVIDAATNSIVETRRSPLLADTTLGGPFAEWYGAIWSSTQSGQALVSIDPATGQEVGEPVPLPAWASGVALGAGEGGVWFRGFPDEDPDQASRLYRFNPATGLVDVSVDLPEEKDTVAIAVGAGAVWMLSYEGKILRFDLYA